MEEKLLEKCLEWINHSANENNVSIVARDDEDTYHRRVYLVVWNDDKGYTNAYLIRVWTNDEGRRIDLSQDYENCVRIKDFVDTLPAIMEQINRVR